MNVLLNSHDDPQTADQLAREDLEAESPVSVRDGHIFWRGCCLHQTSAERLAECFERVTDWFEPEARSWARDLRAALAQVQSQEKAA